MKTLLRVCALAAACITSGTASAAATDYAIGTDLIRWVDPTQENGMANISFQKAMGREDAFYMDFAMKDDRYLIGMDYKVYNQRYYYGTFMQMGLLVMIENGGDSKFGLEGAIGYEYSPFQNWVLSGAVQMTYGPSHPVRDSDAPWFTPRLQLMYTF
ncbi:MAG: hypothetical protein CMI12_14730 [Oceanospirillum sp.]|nr:hypothetical protein [Oceanospirillum sp.]